MMRSSVPPPDALDPGHLTRQLLQVSAMTDARVAELLKHLGLTPPLAAALWALDAAGADVSMSDVALALGCDRSNVTLLSEKLEAAGLAQRLPHPDDRRARVLRLTPAGRRLRRRLDAQVPAITGIDRLSNTERRQLSRLLTKLDA